MTDYRRSAITEFEQHANTICESHSDRALFRKTWAYLVGFTDQRVFWSITYPVERRLDRWWPIR